MLLKLQEYDDSFISRAQAKSILKFFPLERELVVDFSGVDMIGQPFADEMFRVFRVSHPQTKLYVVNTTEDIDRMIKHVL